MYIDTHAHLNDKAFDKPEEYISRAAEAGVSSIIIPGSDYATSLKAIKIAEKNSHCFAAVGIHPHDAEKTNEEELERIRELLAHKDVVAAGEVGLDYHYNFSPPEVQRLILRKQVKNAIRMDKPLILHSRESQKDLLEILKEPESKGSRGVVHCFSGTLEEAREFLKLGFYLGFTGVITFPKSGLLREVVAMTPLDRILSETDAPYMSPVPMRGKKNEPSYVVYVADKLAEIKNISPKEMSFNIKQNTEKLFSL